jgi:hypothetical protein
MVRFLERVELALLSSVLQKCFSIIDGRNAKLDIIVIKKPLHLERPKYKGCYFLTH